MTSAKVNLVSHPLVQHKLTLMRERDRSIKGFRELLNEIGTLLCYEVTADLPLEMVEIETPLTPMKASSCGTSARSPPTRQPATITVAPRSRRKSASPILR